MLRATWDILILSLASRTASLERLLDEIAAQLLPGVGVLIYRDNRDRASYAGKMNALLAASQADYVSFIDDDDMIAADYVQAILEALDRQPDQVGFRVRYTESGVPQLPVVHSLSSGDWINAEDALYRDLTQFSPIRRDLALLVPWQDGPQPDRQWADGLRERNVVKTEVFIDRELYHYQHELADTFDITRMSQPMPDPPARPERDFVRWL